MGGLVLGTEIQLVGDEIICEAFETLEDTGSYEQILDQLKQHADQVRPILGSDHYSPSDEPLAEAILQTVTAGQCAESISPFEREGDFPVQSLHRFGNGRRLAIVNERFLALLPAGTAADDVVCILNRSRVPCLLRPRGDGLWQYVGWVYLHWPDLYEAIQKQISGTELRNRTEWPVYGDFDIV